MSALNPPLIVIHLARKPLVGTVASNASQYGTGGLNIDGSRISGDVVAERGESWARSGQGLSGAWHGTEYVETKTMAERTSPLGRWPANLILQHLPGCVQVGAKKVRSSSPPSYYRGADASGSPAVYGTYTNKPVGSLCATHTDPDGTETIAAWACDPGCPVADLDEQSGNARSAGLYPSSSTRSDNYIYGARAGCQGPLYEDTGGASRFFKQVKSE